MNVPEIKQSNTKHENMKGNSICLDPKCSEPSSICKQGRDEDHQNCERKMIVIHSEIDQNVDIDNGNNREQFQNDIEEFTDKFWNDYRNAFEGRLDRLLKVYDNITREDLKDPETVKMVKKNFNVKLTEDSRASRAQFEAQRLR